MNFERPHRRNHDIMKRMGIIAVMLFFCTFTVWAQTGTSTAAAPEGNAAQTLMADNNSAAAYGGAPQDSNAPSSAEKDTASARLDDSSRILNELLSAPDKGIPDDVFKSAKCVAVVPSMVKGGFIFGAEHGRGVATCRTHKGWSAPAFFVITGGSWGAQIGVQAADVVMLIMNDRGMNDLLSSEFKLGGSGSVAAGPVGREASASTDWKMNAEVLTYSRTRGLFAGLTLNGAVIKQDDDATRALYGRMEGFRRILTGQVHPPAEADHFLATVRRDKAEAESQGH